MTVRPMTDFDPEPPKNLADWRDAVWYRLGAIHDETKRTNGRVTRIERAALILGSVAVGYAVASGWLNPASLLPWL